MNELSDDVVVLDDVEVVLWELYASGTEAVADGIEDEEVVASGTSVGEAGSVE